MISLLHNKGDALDFKNYRAIAIFNTINKVSAITNDKKTAILIHILPLIRYNNLDFVY